MPFSYVASAVGIASGLNSLFGDSGGGGGSSSSSGTYDPFGQYRQGAAEDLYKLYKDPSLALSSPGYQQTLQQGTQAVQRGMAASGGLQSGAEQAALQSLGQNTFGSYYNTMLANLMQMSGASQNPASAALAQQQAANIQSQIQQRGLSQLGSGLGGLRALTSTPSGYTSGYTGDVGSYFQSSPADYGSYGGSYDFSAGDFTAL